MAYRLREKEEAFQVTREGKWEYRSFTHGKVYDEVPLEEIERFEEVEEDEPGKGDLDDEDYEKGGNE